MRFSDVLTIAFAQIRNNKLRSFFTLLGIIVSVAFLVAVTAIIEGMNAYVKENVADAMIGANTFQVRQSPVNIGRISDDEVTRIGRRPKVTQEEIEAEIIVGPCRIGPVIGTQHEVEAIGRNVRPQFLVELPRRRTRRIVE